MKPARRSPLAKSASPRSWAERPDPDSSPTVESVHSRFPNTKSASFRSGRSAEKTASRPRERYRLAKPKPTEMGESPSCRSPTAATRTEARTLTAEFMGFLGSLGLSALHPDRAAGRKRATKRCAERRRATGPAVAPAQHPPERGAPAGRL